MNLARRVARIIPVSARVRRKGHRVSLLGLQRLAGRGRIDHPAAG